MSRKALYPALLPKDVEGSVRESMNKKNPEPPPGHARVEYEDLVKRTTKALTNVEEIERRLCLLGFFLR